MCTPRNAFTDVHRTRIVIVTQRISSFVDLAPPGLAGGALVVDSVADLWFLEITVEQRTTLAIIAINTVDVGVGTPGTRVIRIEMVKPEDERCLEAGIKYQ
jgi:hypothetical protein